MKRTHLFPTASLALGLAFSLQPLALLAQGSLAPPGAPAPTMKTLSQVEPRTPISSAPFTISVPGSYYLTTNLTVASGDAITIATNGVTLDLGGFVIASTASPAASTGVLLNSGLSDLTICNGHIRGGVTNNGSGVYSGSGFAQGIYYAGTAPVNVLVSRVSVSGCRYQGINLNTGNSTVVESTVQTVGGYGIMAATIKSSVAMFCGNAAVYGNQVADCWGSCTGSDYGLHAWVAQNCTGSSSSGEGLYAYTAQNCYGASSGSSYGLHAAEAAQNCYGHSTSGGGLYTDGNAQNCYGSSNSGDGLNAYGIAEGCYGSSNGAGYGVYAYSAQNCRGSSNTGTAVSANATAQNCYGYSSTGTGLSASTALNCCGGTGGNGTGLVANYAAQNCYGSSSTNGAGLAAGFVAQNCMGYSGGSGTGLFAGSGVAIGCAGSSASGAGLVAYIANSCRVTSGSTSVTYKYNMP